MFKGTIGAILSFLICNISMGALAQTTSSGPPQGITAPEDNRIIPSHAKLCTGDTVKVVDKSKLFFQLLANASPPVSDQLKFAVGGDWHKLVTDKNLCPQFRGCGPKDAQAIASVHLNYTVFVADGDREGYYRASHPDATIGQYFQNANNESNAIYCTNRDEPPPTPPSSPIDANSPVRLRGISDDLWIDQKSPLFAKSSSAAINYTENDATPGAHTGTTSIQAALGYDIPLPSTAAWFSHEIIPFTSASASLTNTQNKPRVLAPTNFVAGGFLYDAAIQEAYGFDQITVKPQQVSGTTMRSELTSLQLIYAPWIDAAASAPLPPLNTMVNVFPGNEFFPHVNGQLLFDIRNDAGVYENRGDPSFVARNMDFERIGSKFGIAWIATPSSLPTFALSVTETALYGATGAYRTLSYFDSLLSIYFDPKHYVSMTFEYFNGRDENTYIISQGYKAGFAGKF
jgi:hypothetical protein